LVQVPFWTAHFLQAHVEQQECLVTMALRIDGGGEYIAAAARAVRTARGGDFIEQQRNAPNSACH